MSDWLKGVLIFLVTAAVCVAIGVLLGRLPGGSAWTIGLATIGVLYGLESAILVSYDLGAALGWLELGVDLTWSLPNTVFGFIFGNIIYIFFGSPSRAASRNGGWIVFLPRRSAASGFGHSTLQTLGTVNLGGAGQHERMHVLQARIFGPLYLPLFATWYLLTFTAQVIWTFTLGGLLWLTKLRHKPYFDAPAASAVSGFWGWIYYATPFELWAYASGNP